MTITPPVREMIRQAIEKLVGSATNAQIRDTILARYPDVNPGTINMQMNACTVNSPSRVHLPENAKPRAATDPRYDFLFRVARGQVVLYDPKQHGAWEILKDVDGRPRISLSEDTTDDVTPVDMQQVDSFDVESAQAQFLFSLERHLRDFLAVNIGSLEVAGAPLSIYANDAVQLGVEYPTGVGPIDILAIDAVGDFVVFELKLGRGPDAAVGQLARYMGWVSRNLADGRRVRGIIVAKTVDEKLRYAASVFPNVSLYEYRMSFALEPADEVDEK